MPHQRNAATLVSFEGYSGKYLCSWFGWLFELAGVQHPGILLSLLDRMSGNRNRSDVWRSLSDHQAEAGRPAVATAIGIHVSRLFSELHPLDHLF